MDCPALPLNLLEELRQTRARLLAEAARIGNLIEGLSAQAEPQVKAPEPDAAEKNIDTHIFMLLLQEDFKTAYRAVLNGLRAGTIEYNKYEKRPFNFLCKSGSVRLMFSEAGCTDYKMVSKYITVNGRELSESALGNGKNNPDPLEWPALRKIFFQ